MRRFVFTWLVILLCALVFVPGEATAQERAEQVRISIASDQWGLTPYDYNTGYPGYIMMSLLYDNLLWYGPDGEMIPWLASDYTVSEDGLSWTFMLREDATWHDGAPVTAEDVAFTMDFIKNNNHLRWTGPVTEMVESVDALDEHTAVITLTTPSPGFAPLVAADVPIMPKHVWEGTMLAWGEPVEVAPIGSGPYKLVEHVTDEVYRMEANPDYWGGAPLVDELIFPIINDTNAAMAALQSGQIDFATQYVPPEGVASIADGETVAVARAPGYVLIYVLFHCDRAPMDDLAFRQALSYAIDVEDITHTLLGEYGVPGSPGYVPPSAPWAAPIDAQFDPDHAAQLLDDAGYLDTDGDGWRETPAGDPIDIVMHTSESDALRIRAGELVAEYAAAVGLRINPTPGEFAAWMTTVRERGDYQMAVAGWSAPVQQDPFRMQQLFHTEGALNFGEFSDADLDMLIDAFNAELDPDARQALAADIQARIAETAPYVPLYYPDVLQGYNPGVYDGWLTIPGAGAFDKQSFLPR
ncbi:MAG: ABC transporter substrate-binding protein [Anaerolineae bacterium]|nr:ABC transporter substrate-binding protein [Anaerolineae bacterium]